MPESPLHLVKVPLRADRLVALAQRRQIRVRDLDEGYLAHCLLAELWQLNAPAPFVLRGRGRIVDVWGYSRMDREGLATHARDFGDPSILDALDSLGSIASKPMPRFGRGRNVGFVTRVCPVSRLAREVRGHRAGAEVDVFLAKAYAAEPETELSRESVYCEWFLERFANNGKTGARVTRVRVAAMQRRRVVRRTQGSERSAKSLERPDVHLDGDLTIEDGDAFLRFLSHGIGRHRAFGFGALLVVPPGTMHDPS